MIDAHTHIHAAPLPHPYPQGLTHIASCAINPSDWQCLAQAAAQPDSVTLLPAFGLHPWYADQPLEMLEQFLIQYPQAPVGECGLCGLRKDVAPDIQQQTFEQQLHLARRLNRAVIIHGARTWDGVLQTLKRLPPRAILLHSFSGAEVHLKAAQALGAFYSIGPMVLNTNAVKLRALAAQIPSDKLLIETDAEDNERLALLRNIIQTLATLRNTTPQAIEASTTQAAKEFYSCR